jgi:hypothetical protein
VLHSVELHLPLTLPPLIHSLAARNLDALDRICARPHRLLQHRHSHPSPDNAVPQVLSEAGRLSCRVQVYSVYPNVTLYPCNAWVLELSQLTCR